jgi:uncharacterized protein (TIGR03437 family)
LVEISIRATFAALLAVAALGSTPRLELSRAPLLFQPNQGQSGDHIRYLSAGVNGNLWVTETEILFGNQLGDLSMRLEGARELQFNPREPHKHRTDYYRGSDLDDWILDVPSFARLHADDVYPGIDLELYGTADGALQYDFIVGPTKDPATIRLNFKGADSIRLSAAGDLILEGPTGNHTHGVPYAYQIVDGQECEVRASFELLKNNRVGFHIGDYDRALPLVIDPRVAVPVTDVVVYRGGTSSDTARPVLRWDWGSSEPNGTTEVLAGITGRGIGGTPEDNSSDGYLMGYRIETSAGLRIEPTRSMVIDVNGGFFRWNKFSAWGSALVGIALTSAQDVPRVNPINSFQENDPPPLGGSDVVLMLIEDTADGFKISFSDYFGGDSADTPGDVLILDDNIFATFTSGRGVDTTAEFLALRGIRSGIQATGKSWAMGGQYAPPQFLQHDDDLFVVRNQLWQEEVNAFLERMGVGEPQGIDPVAAQLKGEVTAVAEMDLEARKQWLMGAEGVDGLRWPRKFGKTDGQLTANASALSASNPGGKSTYLLRVDPATLEAVSGGWLGGSGDDRLASLSGSGDCVLVAGSTNSTDFPVTANAFQSESAGGVEAFAARVCYEDDSNGELIYSTYIGGPSREAAAGAAALPNGVDVFVGTGGQIDGAQSPYGGGLSDAFIAALFVPRLRKAAIVRAADFQSGPIAPGEILSFFGLSFGPEELITLGFDDQDNALTQLGPTRVLFDGEPAPMIFTAKNQFSAIAPFSLAGKTSVTIQVEVLGRLSNPVEVPVTAAAPGIFTLAQTGQGQGAVLNQDFSVNGPENPAAPGSVLQIFLTGAGQTDPPGINGKLIPLTEPFPRIAAVVSATIDGRPASIAYAGGAPGLLHGVNQFNVVVPADAAANPAAVLVLSVGGQPTQADVTVAIGP